MRYIDLGNSGSSAVAARADLLDHLRGKLVSPQAELLHALVEAINDRTKTADLDRHPLWRTQSPVALDVPWPPWSASP